MRRPREDTEAEAKEQVRMQQLPKEWILGTEVEIRLAFVDFDYSGTHGQPRALQDDLKYHRLAGVRARPPTAPIQVILWEVRSGGASPAIIEMCSLA